MRENDEIWSNCVLKMQEEDWQKDDNGNDDEEDEDRVLELCERLYEESAKCNKNFEVVNDEAYYVSERKENLLVVQTIAHFCKSRMSRKATRISFVTISRPCSLALTPRPARSTSMPMPGTSMSRTGRTGAST